MQEKTKGKITVRTLVFMGLMVACSIVFGKLLALNITTMIRISLENLPIIISGITLGWWGGLLVGAVADLVGCLIVGYEINPIITIASALIGLLSGLIYKNSFLLTRKIRIALSVAIPHIIGSIIIKTVALASWYLSQYNMGFWTLFAIRSATYVLIGIAEAIIIFFLLKNKSVSKYLSRYGRGNKNEL